MDSDNEYEDDEYEDDEYSDDVREDDEYSDDAGEDDEYSDDAGEDDEYSDDACEDDEYSDDACEDDEYEHFVPCKGVQKGSTSDPGWSESKTLTSNWMGEQSSMQERTYRAKNEDRQTGSYERFTAKEKVSTGERFVERSSGRVGFKDEHKTSSTFKVGDKRGYTEYYTEQKVQRVNYDNSSSRISYGQNSNKIGYGNSSKSKETTGYAKFNP